MGGRRREQKDERATEVGVGGVRGGAGDEDKQVSKSQTALVSISNERQDIRECFLLCRAAESSSNFAPHVKKCFVTSTLETMLFFFFPPYLIARRSPIGSIAAYGERQTLMFEPWHVIN